MLQWSADEVRVVTVEEVCVGVELIEVVDDMADVEAGAEDCGVTGAGGAIGLK